MDRRVADLGEALDVERSDRHVGGLDQGVEAADEGADADQDHSSRSPASTARGNAASFSGHWTTNRSLNG